MHNDKVLLKIHTNKGVTQGYNLSPQLFNIYINYLPQIQDKADPIQKLE